MPRTSRSSRSRRSCSSTALYRKELAESSLHAALARIATWPTDSNRTHADLTLYPVHQGPDRRVVVGALHAKEPPTSRHRLAPAPAVPLSRCKTSTPVAVPSQPSRLCLH
ncbi:hypothetical protein AB0A98_37310 [Streptomyces chrestomyceticus]|uniref:hypothetical protein n=1 Tax=Streptomyces chrestomyceticus TaxID=68185 RepID=UPI0033E07A58